MTPKKDSAPTVVGRVDEVNGTVSVGVVHEGAFLPVASADLNYAKARDLSESGEPDNGGEGDEGGEG